jgi:hypothetical protein
MGKISVNLLMMALIFASSMGFAEEYKLDLSEIEKKPYYIGGYLEFRPDLLVLDKDAALYKLKFYRQPQGNTLEEYNGKLQLEGSYEKGIAKAFARINTDLSYTYLGWHYKTTVYDGYLSLKPSPSFTIDAGKKNMKWGKGYAWNPVAFVDRPKDPLDPELSREGYVVATADYIKSFSGPLKTVSFTPVLLPVYTNVNDTFGSIDHLNVAGKVYFLFYDTDVDFLFLAGQSKTNRVGIDVSRNITTNLEVHGEFAFITNQKKTVIDSAGKVSTSESDVVSYLLGIRYLTTQDTTCILEYYRNGTGYSRSELEDYFSLINNGYDVYLATGNNSLLKKAANVTKGSYGSINPAKDYLYLLISQKEPFNILYFTPSINVIMNLSDKSFTLQPELLYSGFKNFEIRLRALGLFGAKNTEFGEKQNDYKFEVRIRYYF